MKSHIRYHFTPGLHEGLMDQNLTRCCTVASVAELCPARSDHKLRDTPASQARRTNRSRRRDIA